MLAIVAADIRVTMPPHPFVYDGLALHATLPCVVHAFEGYEL